MSEELRHTFHNLILMVHTLKLGCKMRVTISASGYGLGKRQTGPSSWPTHRCTATQRSLPIHCMQNLKTMVLVNLRSGRMDGISLSRPRYKTKARVN